MHVRLLAPAAAELDEAVVNAESFRGEDQAAVFLAGGESGLSQDSQQRRLWFRRLARMEDKLAAD
jgi:hypothetical protein